MSKQSIDIYNNNSDELARLIFNTEKKLSNSKLNKLVASANLDLNRYRQEVISAKDRLKEEDQITYYLLQGDKENLLGIYRKVYRANLFKNGKDFTFLDTKHKIVSFINIISRKLIYKGLNVETVIAYEYVYVRIIENTSSIIDISNAIEAILENASDAILKINDVKHVAIIAATSKYINANLSENICIDDVANHVGLSSNYFSSLFKKEMNIPFANFVNEVRIRKSCKLLLNTNLSIEEIAKKVGFKNQNYFTTIFKKITNLTPKKYRQSNLKNL